MGMEVVNAVLLLFVLIVLSLSATAGQDYDAFLATHSQHAKPISEQQLFQNLRAARLSFSNSTDTFTVTSINGSLILTPRLNLTAEQLKQNITSALNIRFLIDTLPHALRTQPVYLQDTTCARTRHVTIVDEHVGNLTLTILHPFSPNGNGILGLHGHNSSPKELIEKFYGKDLACAGYTVIIPALRAMNCDQDENTVSKAFLLNGFTLMGLHVYETLLATQYARELGLDSLGALAHSGGSSLLHLTLLYEPGITAIVHDYPPNYFNFCGPGRIHDETIPALQPYTAMIQNTTVPRLHMPYNFIENKTAVPAQHIISFFDTKLPQQSWFKRLVYTARRWITQSIHLYIS
ncbi:hypothetical protein HY490_03815 [Candidatus Woesearchaeota archaeon]|nr:hypothetical protein [Candidatus Woesearchaeota archaeon]